MVQHFRPPKKKPPSGCFH